MKLAATKALAALAKQAVPLSVCQAYKEKSISFGPSYIIPKPLDPRVLLFVAPAVAQAAMASGVATRPIKDFKAYHERLQKLIEVKFTHDDLMHDKSTQLIPSFAVSN